MRSVSAILMSRTEAITCLQQIVTLHNCEEKWDEATLISEEIESLALAVLELCLSEGISK